MPNAIDDKTVPTVALGHVRMDVSEIPPAAEWFEGMGLRTIATHENIGVLDQWRHNNARKERGKPERHCNNDCAELSLIHWPMVPRAGSSALWPGQLQRLGRRRPSSGGT